MKDKVATILETRAPSNISHEKRKLSTPELNTLVNRLKRTKKQLLQEKVGSVTNLSASLHKTNKAHVNVKIKSKRSNVPAK